MVSKRVLNECDGFVEFNDGRFKCDCLPVSPDETDFKSVSLSLKVCLAKYRVGWRCTRPKGHIGKHRGCSFRSKGYGVVSKQDHSLREWL